MHKLYYASGTCSMAVHVLLNELNLPVTLEKIDLMSGQQRTPDYLKINPAGQVPVLEENGKRIVEGAAILMHLCEQNPTPLFPASGEAHTTAMQWLMFCNASLHPAYGRAFFLKRNNASEALMDAACGSINNLWAIVEQRLSQTTYLCGENPTVADILLTVIANWSGNIPKPIVLGPKCKALFQKIITRPAFQKAMADEQVEYKAAA